MGASTLKAYNTFVKGIITEAGPLTFPENASLDEENTVLNRDGSRQRRLGMDFEDGFALSPVTLTATDAARAFLWDNVANDPSKNFAVVQVGSKLLVFDAEQDSISPNLLTTLDLSGIIAPGQTADLDTGLGYLFVVGGADDLMYVEYNPATNTFTTKLVDIKVRDVWGVPDGLRVDEQPATLSTAHKYNLYNQGWLGQDAKINSYFTSKSVYPSNAQQWFLGRKDSDNSFDPAQLAEQDFGTTPAPKGRLIISLFDRSTSRDALTGLTTPADIDTTRPTTVAFGMQRVWLAGMQSTTPLPLSTSPNLTGMVLYSRTIRSPEDFGQFYTDADPTSENDSELVDTDGGFVIIPDSGKIHKLVSVGSAIVVLAENGIWVISGGYSNPFTAANQDVSKISAFGALAPNAVVQAESDVFYWNKGGIYLITSNDQGTLSSTNITENSIQTLFNSLDQKAKRNAVGEYDPVNKKVMWMYNDSSAYTGAEYVNSYNRELVLDLSLEAWTKNSISAIGEPSPYIAGYLHTPDFLLRREGVRSRGDTVTKYLVIQFSNPAENLAGVSFSYYRDEHFRDWKSYDNVGVSFLSYVITGYETMGDSARSKQAPYIVVHSKFTETEAVLDGTSIVPKNPSGLYMQAQWGWANSYHSGRWMNPQQVYRLLRPLNLSAVGPTNFGDSVVTTKNRVRGSGKALSLYFYSDGDKDFYLHGWTVQYTGQQNV